MKARYRDFWADRRTGRSFGPGRLVAGERSVWVLDMWLPVLIGIDPSTHSVSDPIQLPRPSGPRDVMGLTAGEGAVWASWADGLVKVDERTRSATEVSIEVQGPDPVAVGGGAAWVAGKEGISRIDARTDSAVVFDAEIKGPVALKFGQGHLWVLTQLDMAGHKLLLSRYSPDSPARPDRLNLEGTLPTLAIGDDAVWIRCFQWGEEARRSLHSFLIQVNPESLDVVVHETSDDETSFAVGSEVWFSRHTLPANSAPSLTEVRRVDPATWGELGIVRVEGLISSLSLGPSGVWGSLQLPREHTWRVCRIDPDTNSVVADLDLADVDVRRFLPPPPDPIDPEPVERELRDDLGGMLLRVVGSTPRYMRGTELERVIFEDVRLEGSFPNTEVLILFRWHRRPGILFGRREPIWSDDGVFVTDGPAVIATNLEERIIFEPGLPLDDEPDATGVVWI